MGSSIFRSDIIDERQDVFGIAVIKLKREVNLDAVVLSFK